MRSGNRKMDLTLISLLVLAGLGVALLVAFLPAGASITGDQPPMGPGDWQIDNATQVIDEEIFIEGNVVVNNTLTLYNGTITIVLWRDNDYKVNVTTNGNLMANDSLITSQSQYYEYGFTVYGKMTLKTSIIMEVYNGIRVLTQDTVLIERCSILKTYGSGIYMENANKTTLRNIMIQSDDASVTAKGEMSSTGYADRPSYAVTAPGAGLYVNGGTPIIDGVNISVNGTVNIEMDLHKDSYYYGYFYTYAYFPIVGINSKDMKSISGINIRDCTVDFRLRFHLYSTYVYSYHYYYLYSYFSASGVNVLNYGDVTMSDCTATNVKIGTTSTSYTWHFYASRRYCYPYNYNQGMKLFAATINEKPTTPGPHTYKMTLADANFEDVGVLGLAITPNYAGTIAPTFVSRVVIDNVTVNKGSNPFQFTISPVFSMMKTIDSHIRVSNCTFTNMTGSVCQQTVSAGPGVSANVRSFDLVDTILIENCTFRWNKAGTQGLFYEPTVSKSEYNNQYNRHLLIRNNKFLDNTGYIAYVGGNYYTTRGFERTTFDNNYFYNNTGTSYFMMLYYRPRVTFKNNRFVDNVYTYGAYMYSMGGDHNGKRPAKFLISNNTFKNSYASTTDYYNKGFFRLYWGGEAEICYNNVSGLESAFINTYEYTYYAGPCTVWFHHNEFTNCNGTFIYHYNTYADHAKSKFYIDENKAWNNNAVFTSYYDYAYYLEQYDYDATIYFRNNTVVNSTGSVFVNYGNLIITGNDISDCGGYVFDLQWLNLHPPTIFDNKITNCRDVYYIGAKEKGVLKMSLTIRDLDVDCTGNAFYFKNIDATLENVTIHPGLLVAIIAERSNVDAVSSSVPIGSGEVIGEGTINVWFNIEVTVEWANKTHPMESSGVRVEDALVVLYGESGAYYSNEYTDGNGYLREMRIPQWTMKGSFLTIWSPYTITVAKSGVTWTDTFNLNHDYTGPDTLAFLLVDGHVPVIRITSPFEGSLFNLENITLRGFVSEIGSGVATVLVSQGDDDAIAVEVDHNGDFEYTFVGVSELDPLVLQASVWDVATNYNSTMVNIVVDRTPPLLKLTSPVEGEEFKDPDIMILGLYEEGSTVTINGLRKEGTSGTLSERYTLAEGNNTIVVEVTDLAGNSAMDTRTVKLDGFPPTLTVLAPRDGLLIKVNNVTVRGDVEVGATLTVNGEDVDYDREGIFEKVVSLVEGVNEVTVRAEDSAGNVGTITRTVIVDTEEPECGFYTPEEGYKTSENLIKVTGWSDVEGVTLYLNGKQIFNSGTFERTVSLNEGRNDIVLRAADLIGNVKRVIRTVWLDTLPPVITMTFPARDVIMWNQEDLTIRGTVQGAAKDALKVMGEVVEFDANGYFEKALKLPDEDEIEIVILAEDGAGNLATKIITVKYSTTDPMLEVIFRPADSTVESDDSNLYIIGSTTPGIGEVKITHLIGTDLFVNTYSVAEDGSFSVVRTLVEGTNEFTVTVEDMYRNPNSEGPHTVTYRYIAPPEEKAVAEPIDAAAIGGVILAISIALVITAIVVTRSFKK